MARLAFQREKSGGKDRTLGHTGQAVYQYFIIHISRTQYDCAEEKFELVKTRVLDAVKGLEEAV